MTPPASVSVVICAYTVDRWDLLGVAVTSIENQSDGGDGGGAGDKDSSIVVATDDDRHVAVEIVIVVDHAPELLERCRAKWPHHKVISNTEAQGLSGARNSGVAASRGDIIAFLDDDARAEPGWVAHLVGHFSDASVWGVGGHVEPLFVDGDPTWLPAEFGWVVGCSYRGQPTSVREVRNPIGANMAFRRQAFEAVGGFRDGIGRIGTVPLGCEETEFSIRVRSHGGRVLHDPNARVRHVVPGDRLRWRYFMRRCWAEGLSKAAVVGIAGSDAGLSSERSYVAGALPTGLAHAARDTVTGPSRMSAAGRAVAIVTGSLVTAGGFARGRMASRDLRAHGIGSTR